MKKHFSFLPFFSLVTFCVAAPMTDVDNRMGNPKIQQPSLEDLCETAWIRSKIPLEFSEDPFLGVLMFDIDHDGVPEALVTFKLWDGSGSGYNGWSWGGFQFQNGQWHYKSDDDSIGASWNGFYVLTEEGQKLVEKGGFVPVVE